MFIKVCLLIAAIPSTVVGGYFLTKNFDTEKVFGSRDVYLIVKAQKPKTQVHAFRAKPSKDHMYNNGNKNFRCVINDHSSSSIYDNKCEIYKLENSTKPPPTTPTIIDIEMLNAADRSKPSSMKQSDIKEDNFYLLKIDRYIFKDVDNFSNIQLVYMKPFPEQKEFANLRVEALLDGGGHEAKVNGGARIKFEFKDKFKSNLLLVKLTKKDSSFQWKNSLTCEVNNKLVACNVWKITTQPVNNAEFKNLTMTTLDLIDGSTHSLTDNNYYIVDIDSRQSEFETKYSVSQTIKFSSNGQSPTSENTFTVISGVLGTLKTSTNNNKQVTLSQTDQLVFISSSNKIEV